MERDAVERGEAASERVASTAAIDVMRAAWEAYGQHGPEGVLHFFHPDAEFSDPKEIPDRASYRGHDGYLEQQRKVYDLFEEVLMEPVEIEAVGDRVVVVFRIRGCGRDSGITIETLFTQVNTVRDGLIVRQELFLDKLEALRAIESGAA